MTIVSTEVIRELRVARRTTTRAVGWFQIAVGAAVAGLWVMLLATSQVPEVQAERVDIWFHIGAELAMACLLLAAGAALLRRTRAAPLLSAAALGMLGYGAINSPGYYAESGDWGGRLGVRVDRDGRGRVCRRSMEEAAVNVATVPRTTRTPTMPAAERALLWLEALLAFGAYGGAIGLVAGVVDFGPATADLPFGSTLFAGLALGVVNGVLPTVVLVGALRRSSWAELGHLAVGVALVGWVVVQVGLLGWPPAGLQVAYFVYGWVIVGLALVGMRAQHR